ncbi:hypothetical protein DXB65_09395 [Bacteroides oleiciplenus]|uniref:Uncharacterized protein n=1 Tax=Bacteroides oleiciplenus TaxID=626931 RepID=A0A3E5BG80_9BACE|nr:hypothetical protein DXB65_09395 [Bacteroides oleiciplenus]
MGTQVSFNGNDRFSLWERLFPTVGTVVSALGNRVLFGDYLVDKTSPFVDFIFCSPFPPLHLHRNKKLVQNEKK